MFKECSIHASLAFVSYALLLTSGIGSLVYLYLGRSSSLQSLPDFHRLAQDVRSKMNRFYIVSGWLLLTIAMVIGLFQSRKIWGNYLNFDAKILFTIVLWLYYLCGLLIIFYRGQKKPEKVGGWLASLGIWGMPLIVLNFLLSNFIFKGIHHFL